MEIIERKENPLLNRVEMSFRWEHSKEATPTLSEMVAAAAKAEPGSKKELTFVKEVNTRYGRPQTTGIALIYGDAEAATVEPEFVHNRHKAIHSPGEVEKPAAPEPVAEEAAPEEEEEEESVAESEEGGDE